MSQAATPKYNIVVYGIENDLIHRYFAAFSDHPEHHLERLTQMGLDFVQTKSCDARHVTSCDARHFHRLPPRGRVTCYPWSARVTKYFQA